MDLTEQISALIQGHLGEIRSRLEVKGVSQDILVSVFQSDDSNSNPLPKRRMLGSNTAKASTSVGSKTGGKATISNDTDSKPSSENQYGPPKDKYPQDFSKGQVVLVMNYTARSHALFGDFKTTYSNFKDMYLTLNKNLYSPNSRLVFGFGWILKVKSKVDELKAELKAQGIKFREVDMEVYLAEVKAAELKTEEAPSIDDSPSESEEEQQPPSPPPKTKKSSKPAPVKAKKVSKAAPAKTKKTSKVVDSPPKKNKIAKNDWGNFEDDNGFVFTKLPIGKKGRKMIVAVGYQNPEPSDVEEGLATVLPFDEGLEEECADRGHKYLTEDMIETIRKYDQALSDELQELMERDDAFDSEDVDESDDGIDEDGSDSDE